MTTITDLERRVALRIHRNKDPWSGEGATRRESGGTRRVSQALGRLVRKGVLKVQHCPVMCEYVLTPEGRAVLGLDPPTLPTLKDSRV